MDAPLREKLAFYFDDFDTTIGRTLNFAVTGLILASCTLFVAQTYPLPGILQQRIAWLDNGILVVFTLEYLLRLWAAPKRLRYFFKLSSLIDLAVLLPFLIGTNPLNFLRIFRWLRVLRLIRFFETDKAFGVNRDDATITLRILFTIFAIIFVYSGLIYQVEHSVNPEQFATFLDAIYYAVSSISTAGFGDINPISQLGRLLSVLMMLTGLVLIPWQLGDLFKRFVRHSDQQQIRCKGCSLVLHDADARFCKACGTPLPPQQEASPLPTPQISNRP